MVLILALVACLKPALPPQSGGDRPVRVVGVLDAATEAPATDTPAGFDDSLLAVLRARRLAPTLAESPEALAPLSNARETAQRIALLTPDSGALLLVEAAPTFYSELNGQYRWTVAVRLSLSVDDRRFDASFDVPVFLQYHHQREAEAVDASAPVVARRLGELVDTYLAAGG